VLVLDIDIDGISYDLDDPCKRAEAIRRWLKKKAEEKTFDLPDYPENQRKKEPEPNQPTVSLPK